MLKLNSHVWLSTLLRVILPHFHSGQLQKYSSEILIITTSNTDAYYHLSYVHPICIFRQLSIGELPFKLSVWIWQNPKIQRLSWLQMWWVKQTVSQEYSRFFSFSGIKIIVVFEWSDVELVRGLQTVFHVTFKKPFSSKLLIMFSLYYSDMFYSNMPVNLSAWIWLYT